MSEPLPPIAANLAAVEARIADACARAGRDPAGVTLVAVTKYAEPDWVRELFRLGRLDVGENTPQQLGERAETIEPEGAPARWHMIGSLQRNKVRKLLPYVDLIHSVDSTKLAAAIDRIAGELGLATRVLLQVNVSGEESKSGLTPDALRASFAEIASLPRLRVEGLTTIAPATDDPETVRPVFAALRALRDELAAATGRDRPHLSMGMSGDYEVAVEEGATLVRVGGALYKN